MATYIERYRAGEREQVWSELSALGQRVFDEQMHHDALEVARETMRRARHNIEILIARLTARGYCFADSASAAEKQISELDVIDSLPSQMAAFASSSPSGINVHAQNILDRIGAMQSRFAPLLQKARDKANEAALADSKPPWQDARIFSPPGADAAALIAELEGEVGGPLPLSLRAWYEEVGGVSLLGSDPSLNPGNAPDQPLQSVKDILSQLSSMPRSRAPGESLEAFYSRLQGRFPTPSVQSEAEQTLPDPLVIYPIDELLEQIRNQDCERGSKGVELVIAPDDLHKADVSGDAYYLTLPDARADFEFQDGNKLSFVTYLRLVFQWGGFPGWSRATSPPIAEIVELREGLLPI